MILSDTAANLWELPHFDIAASPMGTKELEAHLQALESQAQERGFEKGFESGLAAARQEAQSGHQSLNKLKDELAGYLNILDDQLVDEIMNLSRDIAEKVIREEMTLNPDLVIRGITEAIAAVDSSVGDLTVRLHPGDQEFIESLEEKDFSDKTLNFSSDDSLHRGDCIVSSSVTTAELLIKDKISQVTSNFKI